MKSGTLSKEEKASEEQGKGRGEKCMGFFFERRNV